jgi:hypothetical protein
MWPWASSRFTSGVRERGPLDGAHRVVLQHPCFVLVVPGDCCRTAAMSQMSEVADGPTLKLAPDSRFSGFEARALRVLSRVRSSSTISSFD